MDEHSDLLFVYGTLLDEKNKFAAYLKNNSTFLQKGRFKGKLYDIGEYPGAIADANADGYVYGTIATLQYPIAVLKILDDYEGIGKKYPQPNEYVRMIIYVETGDGLLNCWCYLYNWPPERHELISHGDYLLYLNS